MTFLIIPENKCSQKSCRGCRHHSPEFIFPDETGRKCALIYYNAGGMTLEAIGELYGLTRERIRQIESSGINKLKHPTRIRKFKEFIPEGYDHMKALPIKKIKSGKKKERKNARS
jgi:hypothetical protein